MAYLDKSGLTYLWKKIKALLNNKADKSQAVFYIEGNSTATGVWLGSHSDITSYYDGLTIAYKVNIAGASNLTLNINNLGAVPVVRNTSSAVTTHYGVNSVVVLTYTEDEGTAYWKISDYDSDTKTRSSDKTATKMFIIGATSQSTSGQTTYSNSKCYIGTDNCLYSNGSKVSTTDYTHPSTHPSTMITGLSTVATSGSYNDLSDQPTIPTVPTKLSQFSNDKEFLTKTEVQTLISALETKIASEYLGGYKWQVGESSNSGKSGYVTVKKP